MKKRNSMALAALLLAGCASVPTTQIKIGNVSFKLPKDFEATDFLAIGQIGTNSVKISARSISTKNNPAVIGASTEQIEAHYNGTSKLLREGFEAMQKVKP